jgi:pentatricopeptide repeat protein
MEGVGAADGRAGSDGGAVGSKRPRPPLLHGEAPADSAVGVEEALDGGGAVSDASEASGASGVAGSGAPPAPAAKRRKRTPEQEAATVYRSRIGDCARRVALEESLDLVAEMWGKALKPSLHMYNAVLSVATRVPVPLTPPLLAKALQVFEHAAQAAAAEMAAAKPGTPSMEAAASAAEAAFTSIMRVCIAAGARDEAMRLFHRMLASGVSPRLRTYTPLLQALAAHPVDHATAVATYADMLARHVVPAQLDFACMLMAHAKAGQHHDVLRLLAVMMDSVDTVEEPVAGVVRAYFTGALNCDACAPAIPPPSAPLPPTQVGPGAAPTAAPPEAAARARDGAAGEEATAAPAGSALLAPRRVMHAHAHPAWPWELWTAVIPPAAGVCPVTRRRLRSLLLPPDDYAVLLQQVAGLANHVPDPFAHFQAWLKAHGPFTAVVDGANVGFFHQNFAGGGLMYSQIDAVVRELQRQGKRVLLVIAKRWLEPQRVHNSAQRRPRNLKQRKASIRATAAARAAAGAGGGAMVSAVDAAPPAGGDGAPKGVGESGGESSDDRAAIGGGGGGGGGEAASPAPLPVRQVRQWSYGTIDVASLLMHADDDRGARGGAGGGGGGEDDEGSDDSSWDEDASSDDDSEAAAGGLGDADAEVSGDEDGAAAGGTPYRVAATLDEDTRMAPEIVARWLRENIVYHTFPGTNDDWYWLYAALSQADQHDITVVSNDFMRDHHFHMLAPKAFLKWRERHQAGFHFRYGGSAAADAAPGRPTAATRTLRPVFRFPTRYSHRMQHSEDGDVWHFPLAGTAHTWLVARKKENGGGGSAGVELV